VGRRLNKIFNEDCRETLKRDIQYDYVITSPPDFDELGLEPIKDDKEYYDFLSSVFKELKPTNKVITIVVSNRKHKRMTIQKDVRITKIMEELGYSLLTEKIWQKTEKIDLYRYGFSFVLSFGKKNFKSKGARSFMEDVWFHKIEKHNGYNYQFSKDVVKRCLDNYTDEGDIVYDCFMGIGTTAVACEELSRNYYGSEINTETYNSMVV